MQSHKPFLYDPKTDKHFIYRAGQTRIRTAGQTVLAAPKAVSLRQLLHTALRRHKNGHLDEAEKIYFRILQRHSNHADAWHFLGVIALQKGENREAVRLISKAIGIDAEEPAYFNNLGIVLQAQGEFSDAIRSYRQALALDENCAEAHNNLGKILKDQGDYEAAINSLYEALRCDPNCPETLFNLGLSFYFSGEPAKAIDCYEKALRINPNDARAHVYKAFALLLLGFYEEGWKEYEWRRSGTQSRLEKGCDRAYPRWDGSGFQGKTVCVDAEQGLGDTIQFIRYLSKVEARGGNVVFRCQPELIRLLECFDGIDRLLEISDAGEGGHNSDFFIPLLSLPGLFKTRPDNIPAPVPYLRADSRKKETWRKRLDTGKFKVGLAWAGSPTYVNDRNRSCSLSLFLPLADLKGLKLYSLQKHRKSRQAEHVIKEMNICDLGPELYDFTDTAAVIENLDLILSVDTAVAHLAGALARPVWNLLPFVPDWRWMLEKRTTPWYPTMYLFRQPKTGDWASVVQAVACELARVVQTPVGLHSKGKM